MTQHYGIFFIHTPSNDKIQLEMVMGLQNKLEVHDDGDSSCGFLPVIKRWWLDSRACKSNFRSGFLFSNSSLGLFCITKTFFFFNWGQQPSKLLFPPFIRCRHIMSGIMTKPKKKTPPPCIIAQKRVGDHFPSFFSSASFVLGFNILPRASHTWPNLGALRTTINISK